MSSPPLHILEAADYGGPYAGSFVPWLRAVAAQAARRGHSFEVLFTPVARDRPWLALLEEAGVVVGFADGAGRRARRRALTERLPASGPALVHTHFTGFDLPAIAAARRREARTDVIWHLHTRMSETHRARFGNRVKFGVAGRRLGAVLAVTDQIAATARGRGAGPSRVRTVPNAIDMARNPPRTAARTRAARERLGAGDRPLLLHFGRDWRLKGGDLLLDAVALLARRGVAVEVLTVDGGAAALDQARSLGIEELVRTLPPVADAAELYAAADVFVLSGRAEGVYSLLEAAAAGTGIVATAIPGQAELAAQVPGARVAELDPAALADAIGDLLAGDRAAAEARAAAAREWVLRNADVTVAARAMVDLYEGLSAGA